MKKNDYNGTSLFQDIKDKELRAFNQANIIINLSIEGKNFKNYMEAVPKEDYEQLWNMLKYIRSNKLDNVKQEMIRKVK